MKTTIMKKNYMTPTLAVVKVEEKILAGSLVEGANTLGTDGVAGGAALSKEDLFEFED